MIKTGLGARGRKKKINTVAQTGLKKKKRKKKGGGGVEVDGALRKKKKGGNWG